MDMTRADAILGVDPDKVHAIAAAADRFHALAEVVIPDEADGPDDDWAVDLLADYVDLPEYRHLRALIDALALHEQVNLLALLWLGRGDFSAERWPAALEAALVARHDYLPQYLAATPLLGRHLDAGLGFLGQPRTARHCGDRQAAPIDLP